MSDLREIEGLQETQLAALAGLGLRTTDDLLAAGAAPAGRRRLARELGVDEARVLRWVNHADLQRVHGIGEQLADLLEQAGVDTVPELAQRGAVSLAARLAAVNGERGLVAGLPSEVDVAGWIERARTLPRVIVYRDAPGGAVESALGTVGPARPIAAAAAAPALVAAVAAPAFPAMLEREASEAEPVRLAYDGGIALPAEDRPAPVGERGAWQRLVDRLTGV